jgi:hypothetical protein
MEAPRETPLPPRDREAMRQRCMTKLPRWYSPYVHLGLTSSSGLAVLIAALFVIRDLRPIELLTIPIVYVLSNAVEWRAHKSLLHRRSVIAPVLYDRHTPQHHMLFITEDMAVRSAREWFYVLIPPYGALLIGVANAPLAAALWFELSPNVAALYLVTAVGYVVGYEWLHLAYHLDPESTIGRMAIVRFLRRHHAIHHDPRLMQRWNFNVTVPLWDLVRRTYVRPANAEQMVHAQVTRAQ